VANTSANWARRATPIAPANTTPPTIVSAATMGTILTISGNVWTGTPAPTAYAWKRNGVT
jgi:hypothetical protein